MTAVFNEDSFLRKLDHVTPTQDSIQSLALWIIHHKHNHETICRLWLKKLKESSLNTKQRLALFYLANDVIQNCKRKNARIFQETFKKPLNEALPLVNKESLKKTIERVIDVWEERNVYDKEFVTKLKETLYKEHIENSNNSLGTKSPTQNSNENNNTLNSENENLGSEFSPLHDMNNEENNLVKTDMIELQKLIEEFQPKKLCESINSFSILQNDTKLSKSNVEATRLLDINVEHIKQYRDKSKCANFKIEFQNSCLKLEDFLNKLAKEASERKELIQLLDQGQIFYDAQFKDATTVANAYRIYGAKVHTVKRKIDEIIVISPENKKKPSNNEDVDMEMSDEEGAENGKLLSRSFNKTNSNSLGDSAISMGESLANAVDKHAKKYHNRDNNNGKHRSDPRQNRDTNNVDPRQNNDPRQNRNTNKKSSQGNSSKHKDNEKHGSRFHDTESQYVNPKEKSRNNNKSPSTPVKDENSPKLLRQESEKGGNNHNPLDFLTKFINTPNKSVESPSSEIESNYNNKREKVGEKSSANLSYLVSSLKKFVNTGPNSGAPAALMDPSGFSNKNFDPSSSFQNSFIPNEVQIQLSSPQKRSGTPTKDETYQHKTPTPHVPPQNQPPLPPPPPPPSPTQSAQSAQSAQFMNQGSDAPLPFHPMFNMQPPPPPPPPMALMPGMPPHLSIDPSFQSFMYGQQPPPPPQLSPGTIGYNQYSNQGSKMIISPGAGSNSSISPTNFKSQTQGQLNDPSSLNAGYWTTPSLEVAAASQNQNEYVPPPEYFIDTGKNKKQNNLNESTNKNNSNPTNIDKPFESDNTNNYNKNDNLGNGGMNSLMSDDFSSQGDTFQKRKYNSYEDDNSRGRSSFSSRGRPDFNNSRGGGGFNNSRGGFGFGGGGGGGYKNNYNNENSYDKNSNYQGNNKPYNKNKSNFQNSNQIPTINAQRGDGDNSYNNTQSYGNNNGYSDRGGRGSYSDRGRGYNNNNRY